MTDTPDTTTDPTTDEGFELLARQAGAALRRPAGDDALRSVIGRGRRQQRATRVGLAGVGVLVLAAGALALQARDRTQEPPPSNTTTPTPRQPWLAYTRTEATSYGVRLVHPDGTDDHRILTDLPAGTAEHHDWSPDGRRLVFSFNEDKGDGTTDLWVADVPGTARRLIDCAAPCKWVDEAAFSPDGTRIAFQRGAEVNGALVSTLETVEVSTGATTVLLTAPPTTVYLAPRWSPDGRRLVVETGRIPQDTATADIDGDGIGVVDLDNLAAGVRMLTDLEHFAQNPDWSWSTDRISYAARSVDGRSETDVFTIAPDGTDRVQVTHLAANHGLARFPSFTPDGARIVFGLLADDTRTATLKLATIAVDGTDLRPAVGGDYVVGEQPRLEPGG